MAVESLKILALEPFYGGSHRSFLDLWVSASRHRWTLETLPATRWKWRMRHAAITFAEKLNQRVDSDQRWDAVVCSDMLNLAEFRGLVDPSVGNLPTAAYFHENQFTYPNREDNERDLHFAMTNLTTALSANEMWFNSEFHRKSFLEAVEDFLNRMPDHNLPGVVKRIGEKSKTMPPAISTPGLQSIEGSETPTILWVARWEHDKNPDDLYRALSILKEQTTGFRLSVIGQQFDTRPEVFDRMEAEFAQQLHRFGYQGSKEDYNAALSEADIVVSTANHEFFGIATVEAIAAGAWPLLPDRLSYPEILDRRFVRNPHRFFYDGSPEHLAERLAELLPRAKAGTLWSGEPGRLRPAMERFSVETLVPRMDAAIESLCQDAGR